MEGPIPKEVCAIKRASILLQGMPPPFKDLPVPALLHHQGTQWEQHTVPVAGALGGVNAVAVYQGKERNRS